MPHAAFSPSPRFRFVHAAAALLVALTVGIAHADDYSDVNTLLRQGKADQALAKADAYIAGKPRDPQMRFLRGVILPEPYNNLAALYAAQSQFDKARAALEMAIKLNPDYATAHENLGDVYARLAAQSYGR